MNATDRIVREFNRLTKLGAKKVATRPPEERIVFYVVATRCEIDIDGFDSVYEQLLNASELQVLIDGLRRIGEVKLANEFRRGLELLKAEGFYDHMNWNKVSSAAKKRIAAIGKRVGEQLWGLDEKLAKLLDGDANQ